MRFTPSSPATIRWISPALLLLVLSPSATLAFVPPAVGLSTSASAPSLPSAVTIPSSSSPSLLYAAPELAQYAPQAISLFNNMKTPASIIGGAIVGLGFGSPLPLHSDPSRPEPRWQRFIRQTYMPLAVVSLLSELIAVMWATVAVNQLTETHVPLTTSVWALLNEHEYYNLSWAGVNTHFVMGMLSFSYLIAVRSFFQAGAGWSGQASAGLAVAGLLFKVGILNQGIASGGGDGVFRYGTTVVGLFRSYLQLIIKRGNALGYVGLTLTGLSLVRAFQAAWVNSMAKDDNGEQQQK